jgi:uncharacterized protein YndB with AHSA1/START domain
MKPDIALAPVRVSIVVRGTPAQCFQAFVSGMDRWWNPRRHLGPGAVRRMVVEPFAGGRWYETGDDGRETDWGRVAEWLPPHRLMLIWNVTPDGQFAEDFRSQVLVTFSPVAEGTRIDLDHSGLEHLGEAGERLRRGLASSEGWPGSLSRLAAQFPVRFQR